MKSYQSVASTLLRDLRAVCTRYSSDKDPDVWYQDFMNALKVAHVDSWTIGRALAGDELVNDPLDLQEGQLRALDEQYWLDGFYHDLKTGELNNKEGELDLERMIRRSSLYVPKTRGTTNIAFDIHSHSEHWFEWVLGMVEDHCPDCPYFAQTGPYPQGGLPAHPGDGSTPCLFNCKCHLRRDDGKEGVKPLSRKNYPDLAPDLLEFIEKYWSSDPCPLVGS